jgi:hypothetical protein
MRREVTRSAVILLLAWGCGGSSNYFEDTPEGASGRGGAGQGGMTGGSSGAGGKGGKGGTGGASGGAGGMVGGAGGSASGAGGSAAGAGDAQGGDGAFGGAGSGQGGAAGSPVGGSAGRAGAGQGGGDGGAMACNDPDATGGRGDGSTTESTTTGLNGTFTDSCDGGNLVEHFCELGSCISARIVPPVGGRGGIPQGGSGGVANCPTGNVIARTIDCGGRCQDGACFGWCAEQGKSFEITGISEMRVLMTAGAYDYKCDVVFEGEGVDCRSSSLVGRTVVVTSLGTCNGESTTFGWNDPESSLVQECTFTCTFE